MLRLVFILTVLAQTKCDLNLKLTMAVGEVITLKANTLFITSTDDGNYNMNARLEPSNRDIVQITTSSIIPLDDFNSKNPDVTYDLIVKGLKPGQTEINVIETTINSTKKDFFLVKVHKSLIIEWLSIITGWLYFSEWSISFYPQLYINYKRKSVVGLNFDWLFFNIIGYLMYNTFNMGLYYLPKIQEQYSLKYPGTLIPVQANDLFFSAHGIAATSIMIFQCLIYKRGDQRISIMASIIVTVYFICTIVYVILASLAMVLWLDVLYVCSYIKLCITITKYMPQAYMHYKKNSTRGWSIGGIILDFIGGVLSILQMVLDGYNYDDWAIIIENPSKFGLGILTIGFDLVFAVQHYVLYATTTKKITKTDIKLKTFNDVEK